MRGFAIPGLLAETTATFLGVFTLAAGALFRAQVPVPHGGRRWAESTGARAGLDGVAPSALIPCGS
jgi:hypothetical protein